VVEFDLPDFVGQVRLMAVAYNGSQVSQGEARMRVRYPLVADAYFPRFLAPGDAARLTLFAQNVDAPEGEYRFALSAEGAADIGGTKALAFTLKPRESTQTYLEITGRGLGTGTIRLAVSGPGGLAFNREWRIESRSAFYPLTLERRRILAPGESALLASDLLAPFLPGSASLAVNFSAIRGIDPAGLLQSLNRYPYGCTEQLSSTAMPLLAFGDFALLGATTPQEMARIRARVQEAVDTLLDRQDESGAIGLWRNNDRSADSWLIVYATDFLMQARQRGYAVPDEAVARARRLLVDVAEAESKLGAIDYDIYGYGRTAELRILESRAYAHYLLAQSGQPQRARLLKDADAMEERGSIPARRFLAAALALAGETARGRSMMERADGRIGATGELAAYYATPRRDLALAAALTAESFGPAEAQRYFSRLEAEAVPAESLTTQEKAWLLRAANAARRGVEIRVDANGSERQSSNAVALSLAPPTAALAQGYRIANRSAAPLTTTLAVHGVPRQAPPALASGYALHKRIYLADGTELQAPDLGRIKRQERLVVVLEGSTNDRRFRQTVLADLLPAGWEVEAVLRPPRGKDENPPPYPWLGALTAPTILEQRDDRVVASFDLNAPENYDRFRYIFDREDGWKGHVLAPAETFRIAYVVRAVTPGSFTLPGASVEDMYQPERMARSASSSIRVLPD